MKSPREPSVAIGPVLVLLCIKRQYLSLSVLAVAPSHAEAQFVGIPRGESQ